MKKLKNIFFAIIISLAFSGCHKDNNNNSTDVQPKANFSTDKTTYTAGETVHCKDLSSNAYSWKWTTPNGKTFTSQNLDYKIDSNDLGGKETILLEVASKNGSKKDTISKSVFVNQYILSSDYYAIGDSIYKPFNIDSYSENNNWILFANYQKGSGFNGLYVNLQIFLLGPYPPTNSKIYSLKPTINHLTSDSACVGITIAQGESVYSYSSLSGKLIISITSKGKIHAVFNNIPSQKKENISGDITSH